MNFIKNILHSLSSRHIRQFLRFLIALIFLNILIGLQPAYAEEEEQLLKLKPVVNFCLEGCQKSIFDEIEAFRYDVYKNMLKIISVGVTYQKKIINTLLPNSTNLINSRKIADNETRDQLSRLINFYLSGTGNKDRETKSLGEDIKAIDDVTENANETDFISSVFGKNGNFTPGLNARGDDTSTGIMNMDSLMGPLEYDSQKQIDNAQTFLRVANSFSPPPDVIHISQQFRVPYTSATNTDPKHPYEIIKLPDQGAVQKLKNDLESDPEYRQYKMDYRASIAARTTYFNSLLRFYQERMKQKSSDGTVTSSLAKLEHDSVESRMDKEYYTRMSSAELAEVEHEMLFTLIDIHHDLYLLRQQNEQLIALQALNGLQTSQLGSLLGKDKIKAIGKKIFCKTNDPNAKTEECKETSPTSIQTSQQQGTDLGKLIQMPSK